MLFEIAIDLLRMIIQLIKGTGLIMLGVFLCFTGYSLWLPELLLERVVQNGSYISGVPLFLGMMSIDQGLSLLRFNTGWRL